MSQRAIYLGMEERVHHLNGATYRKHVVTCSCPDCTAEAEIAICGKRKPPAVIHNILKRRGWGVKAKKAEFTCPKHANKAH